MRWIDGKAQAVREWKSLLNPRQDMVGGRRQADEAAQQITGSNRVFPKPHSNMLDDLIASIHATAVAPQWNRKITTEKKANTQTSEIAPNAPA